MPRTTYLTHNFIGFSLRSDSSVALGTVEQGIMGAVHGKASFYDQGSKEKWKGMRSQYFLQETQFSAPLGAHLPVGSHDGNLSQHIMD